MLSTLFVKSEGKHCNLGRWAIAILPECRRCVECAWSCTIVDDGVDGDPGERPGERVARVAGAYTRSLQSST
jgi:hypothetical protein